MDLSRHIDETIIRITTGITTTRAKKIELYSYGILAKYKNAVYALSKLKELNKHTDDKKLVDSDELIVRDRIHFYLDSFFAFIYSTFDVSAQVVNQKYKLGFDEKKVNFKAVATKLKATHLGTDIQNCFSSIVKSNYLVNLEKYRNCSTHRRQIYIRCEATSISETPGYSSTAELITLKRTICDDPYAISPNTAQKRELISYTEKILNWTEKKIIELTNKIN